MTSPLDLFLCRLAAIILSIQIYLPEFIVQWAKDGLARCAWIEGYIFAGMEIEQGNSTHLCCTERYLSRNGKAPVMLVVNDETTQAWNSGYERAILLWRLGIDPGFAIGSNSLFASPLLPDTFDAAVQTVLDGEAKRDPRKWESLDGQLLEDETDRDNDIYTRYRLYCEGVQQIKGNFNYRQLHKGTR